MTKEELHTIVIQAGLAFKAQHLLDLARNAILITPLPLALDEEIPIGQSRLGGLPDLPAGAVWPESLDGPLSFLAQFNLEELSEFDLDTLLPDFGMLYFFYDALDQPWGFDPADANRWKVIYEPVSPGELERAEPPEEFESEGIFNPALAQFKTRWMLPDLNSADADQLEFTEAEMDAYMTMLEQVDSREGPAHHLLGYSQNLQGDMQLEAQLVSNGLYCGDSDGYNNPQAEEIAPGAVEWKLLLQLDSDDFLGMAWGDAGRVYFWLREADLARREFENTRLSLQCY